MKSVCLKYLSLISLQGSSHSCMCVSSWCGARGARSPARGAALFGPWRCAVWSKGGQVPGKGCSIVWAMTVCHVEQGGQHCLGHDVVPCGARGARSPARGAALFGPSRCAGDWGCVGVGIISNLKALFIWSRVPETTLPLSYPGRAYFSLISLKNSTDCLHENANSSRGGGGGGDNSGGRVVLPRQVG